MTSLQIIGQTLYVGGEFQNGAGIASADYLLACDLPSGAPQPHGQQSGPPLLRPRVRAGGRQQRHALRGRRVHQPREPPRRRQRRLPARRRHLAADGRGRRIVRLRGRPASSAASPPSGPTPTSARTPTTSPASRRPTTSRAGTGRRGAPWARTASAATGGSRRSTYIYALTGTGPNLFATGTSRTPTATRAPTTSPSSTAPMAPARVRRRRQRPVERQRPRARARRSPALRGRELHERRRRHPGALRRLVRAHQIIAFRRPP